jgi:hypothetical protein
VPDADYRGQLNGGIMLVISALKQVATAATNAVHSATGNVTGHAHNSPGESMQLSFAFSF